MHWIYDCNFTEKSLQDASICHNYPRSQCWITRNPESNPSRPWHTWDLTAAHHAPIQNANLAHLACFLHSNVFREKIVRASSWMDGKVDLVIKPRFSAQMYKSGDWSVNRIFPLKSVTVRLTIKLGLQDHKHDSSLIKNIQYTQYRRCYFHQVVLSRSLADGVFLRLVSFQ